MMFSLLKMQRPTDYQCIPVFLENSRTDYHLWRTLLSEQEVTNKLKFSEVRMVYGLRLPGRLSTEPVSGVY